MSEALRILVVDDEKEFCQNIRDILEMKGYRVVLTHDGFSALELVKQNSFCLVLMDVKMPGMDGVETFKKIKKLEPDTPVIMITAYAVEDLLREALREGAFGTLKKPLDFDKLFALIEKAIPNKALILVVDDDEGLCVNIKDALHDNGYRVSVAYDGNTAIEKAWENAFDIIILDMKLPVLNGLETYLAIRDIRPNVAVIIITGYPQEMGNLAQQAVQKNAFAYMEKPIDMDDLFSLLGQIKEKRAKGVLGKRVIQ
jgi:DNA-binding NtrC family response regulator